MSKRLINQLPKIQRILNIWNPIFKIIDLNISAHTNGPVRGQGTGLFFAGGIDSSHDLLTKVKQIDTLICAYGFDFQFSDNELMESLHRLGAVAKHYDKHFAWVTTNHSEFLRKVGVSRLLGHGMTLGAIGILLGLRECHIASTFTVYNLEPWGSHPLLDPLFSNDSTEFIHGDNSITRFAKTQAIADDRFLLENLRVCWDSHADNCGRCSKCLRTTAALRIIGKSGPFQHKASLGEYRKFAASADKCWTIELVVAAQHYGDVELARSLKTGLRLNDLRLSLKHLNWALFGRSLQKLLRPKRSTPLPEKWDPRPDLQ